MSILEHNNPVCKALRKHPSFYCSAASFTIQRTLNSDTASFRLFVLFFIFLLVQADWLGALEAV